MNSLFSAQFTASLRSLIEKHHTLYPRLPPQGIFFESLVEGAFQNSGWPADQVVLTTPNSPQHDLLVGKTTISVKSETGKGTRLHQISITKLCTTETGIWASDPLIQHALGHLTRYAHILILRAIWRTETIHYQLLDVPLEVLRLIKGAALIEVGNRPGRRSLAADITEEGKVLFRIHFDGADGKCQIRKLPVGKCKMLLEWDQQI